MATVHLELMRRTSVLSLLRKLDENQFFLVLIGSCKGKWAGFHLCKLGVICVTMTLDAMFPEGMTEG